MQKSITRLFLVACASLSVANLQAMDNSKAAGEALRAKLQQEGAAKSQVEQLQENASKDEAQKAAIATFIKENPELVRRTGEGIVSLALVYFVGVTAWPVPMAIGIMEAANYLTQQDAAAKNPAEIVKEAVEAK